VFESLDEEYEGHQDDFKFNAVGKLKQFIESQGGVAGIVAARAAANKAAKLKRSGLSPISQPDGDIEAAQKWIADNALPLFRNAPSIAWSSAINPGSLTWDDGGHALLSVRKNATGCIEYGPTTVNPNALTLVGVDEASTFSNVPDPVLRLLAEITAAQSHPAKFCPEGSRADLKGRAGAWITDVLMDPGSASKGLPAKRRLVIRQCDILLSTMQTDSSVMTTLTPHVGLLKPADLDVYLVPDELRLIEDWCESNTLAARSATPPDSLRKAVRSRNADKLLRVTNNATRNASVLHFRHIDRADDDPITNSQVELDLAHFTPTWAFDAGQEWFVQLQRTFLNKWLGMVTGNQLKRGEHWLFDVLVASDRLTIDFKTDQAGRSASETVDLSNPNCANVQVAGQGASFSVSSKDFAMVFYNIARAEVIGPVAVSGDASPGAAPIPDHIGQLGHRNPNRENIDQDRSSKSDAL
jgi:hypothetical protein